MNSNRAMMRAKLADLVEKRKITRRKARTACLNIMPMINPALEDVEKMDIVAAADLMDEIVMHQAELLSLGSQIADLEEALYS
ncbi:MAG TPA: hypothetical protein ENJ30_01995 [Desulfobulbaceae bacterium]|nr:hypothetical protein [Desulfobulbaceae bacterium]